MRVVLQCRWLVLAALTLLASCALTPLGEPAREPGIPVSAPSVRPASQPANTYQIDPAASTLHILVYRGGTLARLGHNHVVSSRNVGGNIWRGAALESSGFDITVPVNDLIVDDGIARAAEGDDFATTVSDDAKAGTKANMLRESVLDGARFPVIHIRAISLHGEANAPTVVAALRIKDQIRNITLPVTLDSTDSGMRVKGEFDIQQTNFGITPLSVALGALQVQDTLRIKFELIAKAQ